jgi:hypothetical protein
MNLTINNISKEYPRLDQKALPGPLKKTEFNFVKENMDLYNDDETIKEYIDTFVSKLNQYASKQKPSKKSTEKKTVKAKSTKKKTVQKKETAKPKQNSKQVGNVDLQVSLIKSFVLMHKKPKTKKQIVNLYKRIEKAATELKIRKTSKYSDEIKFAAQFLQKTYNETEGGSGKIIKMCIPEKEYEKLYAIAYSEKQMLSVTYIKRYVGMYGAEDMYERADRLLTNINNALDKKKITSSDLYYDKLRTIQKVLESFVSKENALLYPESINLKGLSGIADIEISKKKD